MNVTQGVAIHSVTYLRYSSSISSAITEDYSVLVHTYDRDYVMLLTC